MSGTIRTRSTRRSRHRAWRVFHRTAAVTALLFLVAEIAVVAVSTVRPQRAQAAKAPEGQGFTVTPGDLAFILKQIKIAERHAATLTPANPCGTLVGPGPDQVPDRLTPYGLRTVGGECNNLFPGRERFAASDEVFPRLAKPGVFRDADPVPPNFPVAPGTPANTSYKQKRGDVVDAQPRIISNLIVDQTSENPAAKAAAGLPVRSQDNTPSAEPCTTEPVVDPITHDVTTPGVPAGCTPRHKTLFIPNVTTDVGLSPPFNSVFTFFGQFFDHGVDQTVKSGATVFVPLAADDPLRTLGPDGDPATNDQVPPSRAFMVLTRAQNQPGPDGILGDDPSTTTVDESADDVQDATNTDTPLVDQSQTYTSHASHQVYLREYAMNAANRPVNTGKLLGDPTRTAGSTTRPADANGDTGMATWASVKTQAAEKLGLRLEDKDVLNVPMLATDPYGNFIPGPARGLPQYVTRTGLVEGNLASPVAVPANVLSFNTPFIGDIAHNADPTPDPPRTALDTADTDTDRSSPTDPQPAGTFDDELLATHFIAGDGRVNENIALTAVHQIFHSEHDRLVDDIKRVLTEDARTDALGGTATGRDALPQWQLPTAQSPDGWNGARLFQAARFITEMEYQHLVFEDFARKIAPAIRPFHIYHSDGNPVIPAEFAHAVYRFGHSMLDDDVARTNVDPDTGAKSDNSLPLLTAFLNPPEFYDGGSAGALTPEQAAGSIFMGSADQTGNEIDEFVVETLRNNLLGLPLDLPTINMTRAREAGVPPLNQLRKMIFAETNDSSLKPYTDWSDYGQHLKHPESLINYVAAYGTHPTIRDAVGYLAKRDAARAIVDPRPATPDAPADVPPADAADFMFSTGTWAGRDTGLDDVDLWVGGLGEVTNLFGGHLGTTFNYVFQTALETLQENDRFYYLNRTPGLNLRNQLEGNSFTELVLRNTEGTDSFKADAFATSDCKFKLANLAGTPAGFTQFGSSVADDPGSECNETTLLLRKPDGTIQYRARNAEDPPGINGQSVYQGSDGAVDRVLGGNDNDTIWGAGGKDVLDGQGGDDVVFGGTDDDIITDLDGFDVLEGGDDDDAIDAGPGDDLILGGDGKDVTNGGINDNETFAGPGDDFIIAGAGADVIFGDGGSDWVEGGTGQDLLQGDHGAPFFDDPGEQNPGHEVMIGQDGENDYDVEGGDDIMSQNAHVDRNAGAGGFDWAFHQFDTVGADDDMMINNFLDTVPLPVVVNRDRWQEMEGDSGSQFNDIIRGTTLVHGTVGGGGFTGCDALDQAGINRIAGLNQLVTTLPTRLADVEAVSATGKCPLTGPNVWAEGDILIGGGGGDTIEGRDGNDIIDGDRALHVRISVRNAAGAELGSTDILEHKAITGNFGPGTAGMTLQQAVFAGLVDPANLFAVREIVAEPTPAGTLDTAVFSGNAGEYAFTQDGSTLIVNHTGGAATDGIDRLTNIERLQFADVTLNNGTGATVTPSVAFGSRALTAPPVTQNVTVTNNGLTPLTMTSVALVNAAGQFSLPTALTALPAATCRPIPAGGTCTIPVSFDPTTVGAKTATLRISSAGLPGNQVDIALTGTGVNNRPATGTPTISGTANVGQTLTLNTSTIADLDGLGPFTIRWEAAATQLFLAPQLRQTGPSTTYVVQPGDRNLLLRAVVTFTDAFGSSESRTSAITARVPPAPAARVAPAASTPLGQALAPQTGPTVAPKVAAVPTSAVTVSSSPSALTVATVVPAGAKTVQISLFSLDSLPKRTGNGTRRTTKHLATVFRTTTQGKRYVFRLTGKRFRHLKPGRYLVSVRVGASRATLGPAVTRELTVKRTRTKIAR